MAGVASDEPKWANVDAPGRVSIRSGTLRDPEPEEIAVRTILSGISVGTELSLFRGTIATLGNPRWGYWSDYPIQPGYELVGHVTACGSDVRDVSTGDRVVCHAPHGTHATVSYQDYVRVPPGLSEEEASLAMLGATTAHGIRKAGIVYGEQVLVLGYGIVGLLSAEHARRGGARTVYVADPVPWKQKLAAERGFCSPFDPLSDAFEEQILDVTQGIGVDLAIEASGNGGAIAAALKSLRPGGRLLLQGTIPEVVSVNFSDYPMHKQITILSTWGKGPRDSEETWSRKQNQELAMELISRGELRVSGLPTRRYPFEKIAGVYDALAAGNPDYLHVLLDY
jgi:2-desacetyl-2-hydroxyethyl bacteriochlorophyllide A dehydrogenase